MHRASDIPATLDHPQLRQVKYREGTHQAGEKRPAGTPGGLFLRLSRQQ